MKTLTLLLEMRCNNFCFFCGNRAIDAPMIRTRERLGLSVPSDKRRKVRRPLPTMDKRHTLDTAVQELVVGAQKGYTSLSLQGGEPSLWPWVIELCQEASRLGYEEIQMVTNGQRFANRSFSEKLFAAKLSAVVFSILGKDAETHDGQTLVAGSFDRLMEGIRNSVAIAEDGELDVKVTGTVVVSKRNFAQLPDIVDLMADCGLKGAHLHLLRFDLFGDDPQVREWMRFPVEDAVPYIIEARARASARGFTLHADTFPICLFRSVYGFDLQGWHRRHRSSAHKFAGPTFEYSHKPGHHRPQVLKDGQANPNQAPWHKRAGAHAQSILKWGHPDLGSKDAFRDCERCVLNVGCSRVPVEHLDTARPFPLRPLGFDHFRRDVDSIGHRPQEANARLHDWLLNMRILRDAELFSPDQLGDLSLLLQQASLSALLHTAAEEDHSRARQLFYRVLGLHPPRTLGPSAIQLEPQQQDLILEQMRSRIQLREGPVASLSERRGTLWFNNGFCIALECSYDGEMDIYHPVTITPSMPSRLGEHEKRVALLFYWEVVHHIAQAEALRFGSPCFFDVRGRSGWRSRWRIADPGSRGVQVDFS